MAIKKEHHKDCKKTKSLFDQVFNESATERNIVLYCFDNALCIIPEGNPLWEYCSWYRKKNPSYSYEDNIAQMVEKAIQYAETLVNKLYDLDGMECLRQGDSSFVPRWMKDDYPYFQNLLDTFEQMVEYDVRGLFALATLQIFYQLYIIPTKEQDLTILSPIAIHRALIENATEVFVNHGNPESLIGDEFMRLQEIYYRTIIERCPAEDLQWFVTSSHMPTRTLAMNKINSELFND